MKRLLQFLFPRTCYAIERDIHVFYSRLGVRITSENVIDPLLHTATVKMKAIIDESRTDFNIATDYSKGYTRKEMRMRF